MIHRSTNTSNQSGRTLGSKSRTIAIAYPIDRTIKALSSQTFMSVVIPDKILEASGLSEEELLQEIVLLLFQQQKISIGTASNLLEMNLLQFQHLIASRDICIHYDVDDLKADVATLQRLGRL